MKLESCSTQSLLCPIMEKDIPPTTMLERSSSPFCWNSLVQAFHRRPRAWLPAIWLFLNTASTERTAGFEIFCTTIGDGQSKSDQRIATHALSGQWDRFWGGLKIEA